MGPQPARHELALELAVRPLALELVGEETLRGDDLSFHADHFRDGDDTATAVAHAAHLDDHMDGSSDLLTHRFGGQVHAGHADHVLEAGQRPARAVGMDPAERAVVAGGYRLQHVHRFRAPGLTHDDSVGAPKQPGLYQIPHGDLAP